jgi:hypothetical protein
MYSINRNNSYDMIKWIKRRKMSLIQKSNLEEENKALELGLLKYMPIVVCVVIIYDYLDLVVVLSHLFITI